MTKYTVVTALRGPDYKKFGRVWLERIKKHFDDTARVAIYVSEGSNQERDLIMKHASSLPTPNLTSFILGVEDEERAITSKIGKKKNPEEMVMLTNEAYRNLAIHKAMHHFDSEFVVWIAPHVILDKQFHKERISDISPNSDEIIKEWDDYICVYRNSKKCKEEIRKRLSKFEKGTAKLQGLERDWANSKAHGYGVLYDENNPDFHIAVTGQQAPPPRMVGNQLNIQTRNCVDHSVICRNVESNLKEIKTWINHPLRRSEEEVVFCSGGPSLDYETIQYIKETFYDKGVKIFAVKHALKRLLDGGVVPWGCILLDPRQHVADFVKDPHPDIRYFVSSMSDPEVTRILKKNNSKIYGYHAFVGAGEDKLLKPPYLLIVNGSATATRGLSMVNQALGISKFHLFGYDLSYKQKPDLTEKKAGTQEPRYFEYDEVVPTWGGKVAAKTFWTEMEMMAQVQEFRNIYLPDASLKLYTYGDGIIPFLHKHSELLKKWNQKQFDDMEGQRSKSRDINAFFERF